MKCPICGENTAYLYHEDGITQPVKKLLVEIRCDNCSVGKDNIPEDTGYYCEINVIIKRSSIKHWK